ncbi:hypothetical protein HOB10_03450 [Candidatus Parcubacteria bacterium]|nr:hypothetical protein [Candidatus Parcubacteria bacterium]
MEREIKLPSQGQVFIYLMLACQMIAWAWHQLEAGQLSDEHYLVFCTCMMIGQVGAAIECWRQKAWGTLCVQLYFFVWTLVGALMRYSTMGGD